MVDVIDEFLAERKAAWLKANANVNVTIEGHADERGTREYNLALGQKRAEAVAKSLTLLGVASSQVEPVSFGKERPIAEGSTEQAWARNRMAAAKVGAGWVYSLSNRIDRPSFVVMPGWDQAAAQACGRRACMAAPALPGPEIGRAHV